MAHTDALLPSALQRELAAYIREAVRNEVRAALAGEGGEAWVPHTEWPCASRRAACALARSGALVGVRRVGHGRGALYLVRRSDLDAWVEREHATHTEASGRDEDEFEQQMPARGLVPDRARADSTRTRSDKRR